MVRSTPKKAWCIVADFIAEIIHEDEKIDVITHSETRMIVIGLLVIMLTCDCIGMDENKDPCFIEDKDDGMECVGAECCSGSGMLSHPEFGIHSWSF